MRFTRIMLGTLLIATVCSGGEKADRAIHEAVILLEKHRSEMTDEGEAQKIDLAIERLKEKETGGSARTETRRIPVEDARPADAAPVLNVNVADFIDHTERYKGQVVTLPLLVRSRTLIHPGQSLRDLAGNQARFLGVSEDGNRLDMMIDLPRSAAIPKASFGDRLVVTFRCREGDLQRGNEAIELKRPATP